MSSSRRNSIQNNLNNFKRQLTRKIHFELSEKHHAGTVVPLLSYATTTIRFYLMGVSYIGIVYK